MSQTDESLARRYRSMLARYIDVEHEDQLEAAYTLGRQAFAGGMTLLELLDLHRSTVEELLRRPGRVAEPERMVATFRFLAEALSTFEMAQSGYREAQERARLEQERATREHAVALMLQQDLLPKAVPDLPDLDLAIRYQPGEVGSHAGGDWYDVFELDGNRAGLVVGDVTGHGVSAAASMGQLRMAVLAYAMAGFPPEDVIAGVDALIDRLGGDELATMVFAVTDPDNHRMVVVNAGHPPPLMLVPGGDTRVLSDAHDRLVGVQPPLPQRRASTVPFEPGNILLLYTDGLIERCERGGSDGVEELRATVQGFRGTPAELCNLVVGKLAPAGTEDDICIVAAELLSRDRAPGHRSQGTAR